MAETKPSHDWFARSIALVAISLTLVSLYFTHRTYTWQTKESLEEKLLLRSGFKYTVKKKSGNVSVDVVNIGMHPIYIESVQIEVPCDADEGVLCVPCGYERVCSLMVYRRDPTLPNQTMKPVDSSSEATYTMEWDFAKYPLQEWAKNKKLEDELWFQVKTTTKKFRQHPYSSWYQINDSNGLTLRF
jgi:hypothetical protein